MCSDSSVCSAVFHDLPLIAVRSFTANNAAAICSSCSCTQKTKQHNKGCTRFKLFLIFCNATKINIMLCQVSPNLNCILNPTAITCLCMWICVRLRARVCVCVRACVRACVRVCNVSSYREHHFEECLPKYDKHQYR